MNGKHLINSVSGAYRFGNLAGRYFDTVPRTDGPSSIDEDGYELYYGFGFMLSIDPDGRTIISPNCYPQRVITHSVQRDYNHET